MKLKVALLLVLSIIALTTGKFKKKTLGYYKIKSHAIPVFKASPIGFVAPNCPHWTKCWHDYKTGRIKY